MISAVIYSDPACPWAYSESPALRVIEWRYGDQLDWRLVLIGLTEDASQYAARGYTPVRGALGQLMFRRYGMPFSPAPKPRLSATARACRAVVAARLANPGSEWDVFRALQLANFTTPLVLDDDEGLRAALEGLPGVDAAAIVAALDSPEVTEAYESDKAQTRTAEGSAAELQGKTATTDGPVRFTAPSLVFGSNGSMLVAGGFQLVEAYDVLIANLDPELERRDPPETPAPLLQHFSTGLTTQ
jgi:predicted DsbA family dithiol-disulfide isomerase